MDEVSSTEGREYRKGMAFWLVVAFFVFEYLRPQAIVPVLAPLKIPFLLAIVLILYWVRNGDKRVLSDPLIKLFITFIVLTVLGLLVAVNTFHVARNAQLLVMFLFGGVLPFVAIVNDDRRFSTFISVWVAIHVGIAALAMTKGGTGPGGFLEDENDLALALNMAVPYAWYLASSKNKSKFERLLWYGALGILMIAITATRSRGGFVGMIAVLAIMIWHSERPLRTLIMVLVTSAVVVVAFVPETYFARLETIGNTQDGTRMDRLYLWRRAWEMFLDYPIIGVGSGNFPMRVSDYELASGEFDPTTMHLRWGRVAHSLYFTVIAEYGLAGILTYSAMGWLLIKRLRRIGREALERGKAATSLDVSRMSRAMLQSLIGFFTAGTFITVLTYQHFWYFIGFMLALEQIAQREQSVAVASDDVVLAAPREQPS